MEEQAPQWLREAFAAQAQQLQELAAQQANTMATLASRLDMYEERVQATPGLTPNRVPSPPARRIYEESVVRNLRQCLPKPDQFDGKNPALYPQFESILRAKLQIDGRTIGGETEQVWYAFGRLSGEAAGRIHPWMAHAQRTMTLTVDEFFKQIRLAFSDPRAGQKALEQISHTKQGLRPFSEFINEFNRLILEAEGWSWEDKIKKAYLRAAISYKLKDRMIGLVEEETYEAYCSQLRMISDQLAEIKDRTDRRMNWRKERTTSPIRERLAEAMDWEPSMIVPVARTKMRKEPRWASDEELQRRREEDLCLRCGRKEHRVRDCHADLNETRMKKRQVRIISVKRKCEEDVRSSDLEISDDSGKE